MSNLVLLTERNFDELVAQAVQALGRGAVIGYPTETLYGLGVLAGRADAVLRLRKLKGKREPMPALVSGVEMASRYALIDERGARLIKRYWPGPLTLIFNPSSDILAPVQGDAPGAAMRRSSELFAQSLVVLANEPVASTSANRGGKEPLETAEEIAGEFGNELDLIIDAGPRRGMASTVIDLTGPELKLVREGAIKFEEIVKVSNG